MKNELPKTKIDERTGIEYRLEGDYYIPKLTLPKQETIILNKYGRMRLNYLKEHKYVIRWYIKRTFERNSRNSSK